MSFLQVEERHTLEASSNKSPLLLYILLVVTTIYFILSLYFNFNTRSRLESTQAGQWASIESLKQRQSQLENELKASEDTPAQRLGMTEQDLQQRMEARADELQRQQRGLAKRLRKQTEQQQ